MVFVIMNALIRWIDHPVGMLYVCMYYNMGIVCLDI